MNFPNESCCWRGVNYTANPRPCDLRHWALEALHLQIRKSELEAGVSELFGRFLIWDTTEAAWWGINRTVSRRWGLFGSPALCSCFMAALKAFTISLSLPLPLFLTRSLFPVLITYFDPGRLCLRSRHKCPYFPRTLLPGWPPDGGLGLSTPWTSPPTCTRWCREGAVRWAWLEVRRRGDRAAVPAWPVPSGPGRTRSRVARSPAMTGGSVCPRRGRAARGDTGGRRPAGCWHRGVDWMDSRKTRRPEASAGSCRTGTAPGEDARRAPRPRAAFR